ncbi:MAG: hypothetical protein ACAI35_07320 [Candidatus Methylacidiphilales bacterium]|nr:hypothetical protein [Candidatus Methylacidiphilales bacterium]
MPSHTLALDAVRNEVDRVAKRCKSSNWDGYGAEPVQPATYWYIHAFVDHIPPGIEMPSIGSESDGHMTLEWYRSPERVLSVSVSPEGELHYAALLASERRMGTLKLASSFPEVIYHIIREVTSR